LLESATRRDRPGRSRRARAVGSHSDLRARGGRGAGDLLGNLRTDSVPVRSGRNRYWDRAAKYRLKRIDTDTGSDSDPERILGARPFLPERTRSSYSVAQSRVDRMWRPISQSRARDEQGSDEEWMRRELDDPRLPGESATAHYDTCTCQRCLEV